MSYSIVPILHPHSDKNGLSKINIQVIYKRMKVYAPTEYKVKPSQFENGIIKNHQQKNKINSNIRNQINAIENRLLDVIRTGQVTKQQLNSLAKNKPIVTTSVPIPDYVQQLCERLKGKFSKGRLAHYKVIADKIITFDPDITFETITVAWLQNFESWLRKKGYDNNTLFANMGCMKAILNKAAEDGLIKKEQFEKYKKPKYIQKIPSYLNEDEMNKIFDLLQVIEQPSHKLAGYYFLLSCNTGYRISDSKRFDYNKMVQGKNIILRANKNAQIISIPVHKKLKLIIDYIKDKPLTLSEQKVREYVKEICSLVGIKKKITFHMSRHSWAMLLMSKGFTIEEVATTLGDTKEIAAIYARITNEQIGKKIIERLG